MLNTSGGHRGTQTENSSPLSKIKKDFDQPLEGSGALRISAMHLREMKEWNQEQGRETCDVLKFVLCINMFYQLGLCIL